MPIVRRLKNVCMQIFVRPLFEPIVFQTLPNHREVGFIVFCPLLTQSFVSEQVILQKGEKSVTCCAAGNK